MPSLPDDIGYKRTLIANVVFIGQPGCRDWVLVDAGIRGFEGGILDDAARRHDSAPPAAIVLTHGHFDHVGSLLALLERWDVPVYAHARELPYLTGQADYPPADPEAGGGLLSALSPLFPRESIHLGGRVAALPQDGSVPGLPDWRWLPTPGHTPGHVSLFRESDRMLIAGDAFTTIREESLMANLTLEPEVHRPPAYFTADWPAARDSVRRLSGLEPEAAITGHGAPMSGAPLRDGLAKLAREFDRVIPRHGDYARL